MTEPSWRAEARAMTEAVPYARSQRIRRRLRQRADASTTRKRRHGAAIAGFAAGAALVMLAVFVLRPTQEEVSPPPPAATSAPMVAATPRSNASLTLHAAGCEGELAALAEKRSVALVGPCELTAPGLRIAIATTATTGGDARSVVLDAGEIELDVDPDHPRDVPFSVMTPAGRIEVTGTRFRVRHDPDGGAVTVHEGHVRLVMAGQTRHVAAGEHVAWVAEGPRYQLVASEDETASAPKPELRSTSSTRRPKRDASSATLIEEVEQLRVAGRFAEAAATIEAALPSLSRRDREVLSFELGKLTERSRGKAAACDHWHSYGQDFARGRYADLVTEERARLGCNDMP